MGCLPLLPLRLSSRGIDFSALKFNGAAISALLLISCRVLRYDRPVEWDQQYQNYEMLFNYINKKTEWNVEAQFGTLQDYFEALHEDMKV